MKYLRRIVVDLEIHIAQMLSPKKSFEIYPCTGPETSGVYEQISPSSSGQAFVNNLGKAITITRAKQVNNLPMWLLRFNFISVF